eukprot:2462651-Prymnesium_polylepis.1
MHGSARPHINMSMHTICRLQSTDVASCCTHRCGAWELHPQEPHRPQSLVLGLACCFVGEVLVQLYALRSSTQFSLELSGQKRHSSHG